MLSFLAASNVKEINSMLLLPVGAGLLPKWEKPVWFMLVRQVRFS